MKKLFLITGASGIGKTTISNEIATRIENCAIIDGDILYHMEHTNKTPAEDLEDGAKRLKLDFKNATIVFSYSSCVIVLRSWARARANSPAG